MKFSNKTKNRIPKKVFLVFAGLLTIFLLAFILNKDVYLRYIKTIQLGGGYVEFLNLKANIISTLNGEKIPTEKFTLDKNDYVKLQKERLNMTQNFILTGFLWDKGNKTFKTEIETKNGINTAKIKLFGMNPDHYRDPNYFSFRIKNKEGGTGIDNRTFNYMNPRSRDYITDFYINILYNNLEEGITLSYDIVKVVLNKIYFGIYLKESFFDKYLIETNRRRDGEIFEISNNQLDFNHTLKTEDKSPSKSKLLIEKKFQNGELFNLIDKEKLAFIIASCIVINDTHPIGDINLHWYYNPVSNKIEPIFREGFVYNIESTNKEEITTRFLNSNSFIREFINDQNFKTLIFEKLQIIVNNHQKILKDKKFIEYIRMTRGFNSEVNKKLNIINNNIEKLSSLNIQLAVPNKEKVFEISKDTILSNDLVINKDQTLLIKNNIKISLNNARVVVYGKIIINPENKVVISGIDKNSNGSIYINSNQKILIKNTEFRNLSNLDPNNLLPSSITFYECNDVNLENVLFENNFTGDDFLNFFRCQNVRLENSKFKTTYADALDSDFSNLTLDNITFENIGNDALDASGSKITISNSFFENIYDKAISSGEESSITISNSNIFNSEQAIVIKDGSFVESNTNILENNKLDLVVFQKKPFYSSSNYRNINTDIKKYLIEPHNDIFGLNNIETTENVKNLLYGNIYGKATKK